MIHVTIHREVMRMHRAERFSVNVHGGFVLTLAELCPAELRGRADVLAYIDSKRITDWDRPVDDWSYVHYLLMPGELFTLTTLYTILASAALSYGISLLFPPPEPPKDRDDEDSPTYGFGGLGNNRTEGLPISVVMGRMRTGGQVINEWVEVLGVPAKSTLWAIYALGEGAIEDVGGVAVDTPDSFPLTGDELPAATKINGNAADNFKNVEMWVRLGTNSQARVPGFGQLHTPNPVGQDVTGLISGESPFGDLGSQAVTGDPFTTARDSTWNGIGRSFDITTPIDIFNVRIGWTQGLYWVDSKGNVESASFRCQFRYRELDGANLPITTGGPNGDGWVRLRDEATHWANSRKAHEKEYTHFLVDPQTWTAPVVGTALDSGTTLGFDGATLNWSGTYNSAVAVIPEFSVSFWYYSDNIDLTVDESGTGNSGTIRTLVSNMPITFPVPVAGGAAFGLMIGIRRISNMVGQDTNTTTNRIECRVGGAEGTIAMRPRNFYESKPPPFQAWTLVTFTYKAGAAPGGDDRVRIYEDGQLVLEGADATDSTATQIGFRLRGTGGQESFTVFTDKTGNNDSDPPGFNGNQSAEGRIDDLCFYNTELSQSYIQERFNTRFTGPPNIGLIARWKFDDTLPAEQDIDWPTPSQKDFNDAVINGTTSTSGTEDGVVELSGAITLKRIKIRLEVLRVDFDNTHTRIFDDAKWVAVSGIVDEALQYPNTALVATKIRATEQLNTTEPVTTFLIRGVLVPHWDGLSELSPDVVYRWSHNPAWNALGLILNARYGLGQFHSLQEVDLPSFKSWADYSDEVVYDGSAKDLATATANPDPAIWDDIRYDNSVTGPDPDDPGQTITRGMLRIVFTLDIVPTANYLAGEFVNLVDVNGVSEPGISIDINNTSGLRPLGGYEIIQGPYFNATEGRFVVEAYWDRLAEGDPWTTNTLISAAISGGSPNLTGTLTSAQHRFAFNGTFDKLTTPWDALLDICAVGRAVPIREGKRIRIRYAHPQNPSALITRGSLVDSRFQINYSGPTARPNAMEISFLDETIEHQRNTWIILDSELRDTNVTADVSQYRVKQAFLFGVTNRAQVERHGNFILNGNRLLSRSGNFTMPVDGLHLEVNDVAYLSHDIVPRGTSGRVVDSVLNSTTVVVLDQPFVIDSSGASAYRLYVRDATTTYLDADGNIKDWEVGTLVNISPGSYLAGTAVEVTVAFSAAAVGNQTAYSLVKSGDELQVEITAILQNEDLTREIEWIEYNAAVFLDAATRNTSDSNFGGGGPAGTDGTVNSPETEDIVGPDRASDGRLIAGPQAVRAKDVIGRREGGTQTPRVQVSWSYLRNEQARLLHTKVYMQREYITPQDSDLGPVSHEKPWELVGEALAGETSVIVTLPVAAAGDAIRFAVQAMTIAGTSRLIEDCPRTVHAFTGLGLIPLSLIGTPTAEMDGRRVRYAWTRQQTEPETSIEIRRGGWVLGQTIHISAVGDANSPWLADFATGKNVDPGLYFAPRSTSGFYGLPVRISYTPDPSVEAGDVVNTLGIDEAWEDFSDGWITDTTPPFGDPTLDSNMVRHADGYIEFTGSNLTGRYDTQDPETFVRIPPVRRAARPQSVFVEASFVAEQMHPLTWEGGSLAWGDLEFSRWTWEGPLHLVGTETQCSVELQWRFTRDGVTWTDYRAFRSGEHEIVECQFRLRVTRPTSAYNVKIRNFATRIRHRQRGGQDRTAVQSFLDSEVFT